MPAYVALGWSTLEGIFQQDVINCNPKTRLLMNRDKSMCPQRNLRENPGKRRQDDLKSLDSVLAQAGITISVLNLHLDLKSSGRWNFPLVLVKSGCQGKLQHESTFIMDAHRNVTYDSRDGLPIKWVGNQDAQRCRLHALSWIECGGHLRASFPLEAWPARLRNMATTCSGALSASSMMMTRPNLIARSRGESL